MEFIERYYNTLLGQSYQDRGVKLLDRITIYPAQGRKRTLILNRKSYRINSYKGESVELEGCEILIPSLLGEVFCFELKLCSPELSSKDDDKLRYLIRSKTNTPFRHNHNLSFESFLERGDQVNLGYNKFVFENTYDDIQKEFGLNINPRAIKSNLVVSIEGETGTGKTTLAKKIHDTSLRHGEFIHLNLSSFSQNLIESELFGHIKGAYTGAICNKIGAFEKANRGTLFLDEIDSLSKELQTKLLLFLDDHKITPVGSLVSKKLDVRLIIASGSNLVQKVKKDEMRKDFYFRIMSGLNIELTPLRNNKNRIEFLLASFLKNHQLTIDHDLKNFYLNYSWPGNIRELLGHLDKKLVYTKGIKLSYDEIDETLTTKSHMIEEALEKMISMKKLKKEYATRVLFKLNGNLLHAAKAIEVTPKTLRNLTYN